jgi:hypothetical protein
VNSLGIPVRQPRAAVYATQRKPVYAFKPRDLGYIGDLIFDAMVENFDFSEARSMERLIDFVREADAWFVATF